MGTYIYIPLIWSSLVYTFYAQLVQLLVYRSRAAINIPCGTKSAPNGWELTFQVSSLLQLSPQM